MHRFSNRVIPSKRKRHITYAAAYVCMRQIIAYPFSSSKEIQSIQSVFFHSCSYWKNIQIKNNILRWKPHFVHHNVIGPLAYFYTTLVIIRLTFLVKSHDNDSSTITLNQFSMCNKSFLTFFQRNRIYHTFPLNNLQARFNDFPF